MLATNQIITDSLSRSGLEIEVEASYVDFPVKFTLFIVILCLYPILYQFSLGFSLASVRSPFVIEQLVHWKLNYPHLVDEMFYSLAGGIQHALLEWSAVVLAFLCVIVSFAHYSMSKDITAPIIGVALLMSGCMDMFHTLAATRLIDAAAENSNLIPFTWAVSRSFNATVLLIGVLFLLVTKKQRINIKVSHLVLLGVALFLIVYLLANWMALSDNLPITQFPNALIARPYEVLPMVIFITCLPLFWLWHKASPSYLSAMMFIGLLPDVFSEAYMAFGSDVLFDHHFNSSHGLKILSYALPFLGYLLDYRQMYKDKQFQEHQLELMNEELVNKNIQMDMAIENLSHSNEQLERFAFVCSHDLQEPIRMVSSFSQLLEQRLEGRLDEKDQEYLNYITDGADRARNMISDVLGFCRLEQNTEVRNVVSLSEICEQVNSALQEFMVEKQAKFIWDKSLPELNVVPTQMFQLIMNLVNNGLKFNTSKVPQVSVAALEESKTWRIEIIDNGIGIERKHYEKLFQIFERLNTRTDFSGTGIGLAICKKITEQHGASIHIESKPDCGSTFVIIWPKN